ncbi:RWD domain-domain-containing protein [Yarrowia lipolytica]|uniref:YALI0D13508p n=2 Tax=Yarrowia lipolytica TaxID=4952 RepID=Q6C972_YARLI|nr:YALI0D13508p [Yarrowia lipolytica CLIB122]AOW04017.1 hypothetical protein YALI1_D16679g [Yarrowia lipolytica]KAB8285160.1 RWD domain-containing protein [Yarrowia lipolytica]KAE8171490.1 RWD domain-containing protein [Yarrowia lipolytica]KAJ8054424.1 RWD domain-containing protein [Yarrowia lipolytica]QNP97831.1 RWD domain-containing protein [Yarrowia lipolytica]|eukprot:XP_502790.1 YALI0D13508p [Yarrowia lipolytica CLIB122]
MDPLEEQQQELEVLQSIYPEEITVLDPSTYTIDIGLDVQPKGQCVELHVKYPKDYPEVVPVIRIVRGQAAEEDYDSDEEEVEETLDYEGEPVFLDAEDYAELTSKMQEVAEENVGMASVFAIASSLKDEAEELHASKVRSNEQKLEQARKAVEDEEQKKFVGTPVTPESFAEWRKGFRAEMGLDNIEAEKVKARGGKMTGKEIFEKGLGGEEEEEDMAGLALE